MRVIATKYVITKHNERYFFLQDTNYKFDQKKYQ